MTSFTRDLPTDQLVERLHDLTPSVPDISPLLDAADPVVERINEALGRSSSRSTWRWLVLGALGAAGIVTLVVLLKRRRSDSDEGTEDQTVRLAS